MADDGTEPPQGAPIGVEKISTAPVPVPSGDNERAKKEAAALAHEQEQFKKELGWLGKPFGGRTEKPGNISALVIVLCFAAMFMVYMKPPVHLDPVISVERIYSTLTSMVTLILGYLFGSSEKSQK